MAQTLQVCSMDKAEQGLALHKLTPMPSNAKKGAAKHKQLI